MTDPRALRRALRQHRADLEQNAEDARLLLKVGDLHLILGEHAEAIAVYERAAAIFVREGAYLKASSVEKHIAEIRGDLRRRRSHLSSRKVCGAYPTRRRRGDRSKARLC